MNTYRKILVGARSTPTSAIAEKAATQLAARLGSNLVILNVADPTQGADDPQVLSSAVQRAAQLGVSAQPEQRNGDAAETIMATATDLRADLLVISDHGIGDTRRFTLGGIPDHVAHFSPIDILVVRTGQAARPPQPYGRVLIGIDGTFTANQAAARGYHLAQALGAAVTLINVGDELVGDIILRDAARRLGGEGVSRRVTRGRPAAQISRAAGREGHDLIVIGNKGMVGSRRYLRSVVSNRLAHEAPVDVLISKTVGRSFYDLQPGEGGVVEIDGEKVAAFVDDDGTTYTVSARCQHLGCTVGWNSRARTWDCPCHGSRYGFDGSVLNGPTTKPLPPVSI